MKGGRAIKEEGEKNQKKQLHQTQYVNVFAFNKLVGVVHQV